MRKDELAAIGNRLTGEEHAALTYFGLHPQESAISLPDIGWQVVAPPATFGSPSITGGFDVTLAGHRMETIDIGGTYGDPPITFGTVLGTLDITVEETFGPGEWGYTP